MSISTKRGIVHKTVPRDKKSKAVNQQNELMKQQTNWIFPARIAAAMAILGALSWTSPAQAQPVTGDLTLDNVTVTAAYPAWNSDTITYGANGITVSGLAAYGSAYFAVPTSELQTLNPADNQVTLVMTVNDPSTGLPLNANLGAANSGYWLGIPFILNDNAGPVTYGGYAGQFGFADTTSTGGTASWNGSTVTETVPLSASQLAAVQAGGDMIYGFNLELDPAVYPSGFENVTFNSLTLSSSVPEPSTLALLGSGVAGLLAWRRRK